MAAVADSVRVNTAALASAAGQAGEVAHAAVPHSDQVQPCAADCVSVAASTRFSTQVSVARQYTVLANAVARSYGVMLGASAAAYDGQEAVSAATLGAGGEAMSPSPAAVPAADVPGVAAGLLGGAGVSAPAGEVPVAPRDIARLIESGRGGAGVRAWQAVEASLRAEASQLEQAGEQLGVAIGLAEGSWDSASARAATTRLRALQGWYEGHARYVGALAQQASTHVANFHRAQTDIPTYGQVVEGERELENARKANIAARGMRREAVVHAQVKVAGLYQASAAGFGSYTVAESVPGPMPDPPPPPRGATPDSPDVQRAKGPSGTPVTRPDPSPAAAPLDPVQQGPGVGESLISGGPTWPPADVDPTPPGAPLLQTVTGAAAAVPQLVPGIVGGVVGGVGGVMGGLAGSGARALQGVQQAAAPMLSGLGQHPGGGTPQGGQGAPESPESLGGEPGGGDFGGGGDGGQTEPAGGSGEMSAPAAMGPAPAAAAPVSTPAVAAAASAPTGPAPAVGAMGPMIPPMGARSAGSGPQNKQLYQERKLAVVAPPNSEPVKNRREGRERGKERDKPRE